MHQLRWEYLPENCLLSLFFQKSGRLSPRQTCMNTSVQDSPRMGKHQYSYVCGQRHGWGWGTCQQLPGKVSGSFLGEALHLQSPGTDQLIHHSLVLGELTNEVPVFLAPGMISAYSHTLSHANRHTTLLRANASEPWKEAVTLRRLIVFFPKELLFPYNLAFKTLISTWTEFQEKLRWCIKSSPSCLIYTLKIKQLEQGCFFF